MEYLFAVMIIEIIVFIFLKLIIRYLSLIKFKINEL